MVETALFLELVSFFYIYIKAIRLIINMEIINFAEYNSIINQYMAEIRDKNYQRNRFLFRNNIMRIGEFEAFEISKRLSYEMKEVETPLGISKINVPTDKIVLATIFRAGLPFHNGFLNIFDHAGNAFVSAYREYTDSSHSEVGIHVEYLATPSIAVSYTHLTLPTN